MTTDRRAERVEPIPVEVIRGVSKMCMNTLDESPKNLVYKVEKDPGFSRRVKKLKSVLVDAKEKQSSLYGRGSGMFWMSLGNIEDREAFYLFGAVLAARSIDTERQESEYLSEVGPQLLAMTSELGGPNSIEPRDKYEGFMRSITMPMMVESILTGKLKLKTTS